jgi:hypothetical protein
MRTVPDARGCPDDRRTVDTGALIPRQIAERTPWIILAAGNLRAPRLVLPEPGQP